MAKRSDDSENFIIHGTLTVLNDTANGPGCIEVLDTVYTDIIRPNTLASVPVDVGEVEFLEKIMTMNENSGAPSVPSVSKSSFYIHDGLLKSINSSSTVTTYQPTTTKGDILTHDGTTQVRLPVSTNTYLLAANNATSTGLQWVPNPTNILTTKGDLLSHDGATQVRLPIGQDGYSLKSKSSETSGLLWEKPSYGYTFSWYSLFLSETTYILLFRFIYKGTNFIKPFTSINIISSKLLTSVYTYSFRLVDITNGLQIAEITGLNNAESQTINISPVSNIPATTATLELHGKLSVKNKDAAEINFLELVE